MAQSRKSIVGLDVGSRKTKAVQLAFTGKSLPEIVTCELLDTGHADESFAANMKAFLGDAKLKGALAAVNFEDPSVVIRKFELPKMPDADLMEAIKWNLRDHAEGDVENYTVKYSKLGEIEEGDLVKLDLVVYAANKTRVVDFKLKVESTGLVVFYLEPEAVTLASALDRVQPDEENYLAGVDIGHEHTKFYVIGKRNFIFSRPIAGVCCEQYEKSPDDFQQRLAIELQKSIDTFQVNFKMQELKSVHLSGGGALIEGLPAYLKTNMGIEVSGLNAFTTVAAGEGQSSLRPELFAQAVSLAYLQP